VEEELQAELEQLTLVIEDLRVENKHASSRGSVSQQEVDALKTQLGE
jgi:3-oxoacyl-(acyl-carrier-protein) synthase